MANYLVCYDINTETKAGRRRLRKVAESCQDVGQRVQFSVFECSVDAVGLAGLIARCREIIDPETDSVRIYRLSTDRDEGVTVIGRDRYVDFDAPLIL